MGASTPVRSAYCSKCREKHRRSYIDSNYSAIYLLWLNVAAVSQAGNYTKMKCKTCGHEYKTKSVASTKKAEAMDKKNKRG